jgi:hypothetical protein
MATYQLSVNGQSRAITVAPDVPLLWVLRDTLNLRGTKFGCGRGICGACTVHVDGAAIRSCVTPVSSVSSQTVTTIEGLSPTSLHPLQQAWIDEDVPQCGYCQAGTNHDGRLAAGGEAEADRSGHRRCDVEQLMPVRHLRPHPSRDQARGERTIMNRRSFLKVDGYRVGWIPSQLLRR